MHSITLPVSSSLFKILKQLNVRIYKGSDGEIAEVLDNNFPVAQFAGLASELDNIATIYGFEWTDVNWVAVEPEVSYIAVLSLSYKGRTKHGLINFEREIRKESGEYVAYHSYIRVPDRLHRQNISRRINGILFEHYASLNVRKIYLKAAHEAGGYVWARAGFAATVKHEVETILKKAYSINNSNPDSVITVSKLKFMQEMFDAHYTPDNRMPFPLYLWALDKALANELMIKTEWKGVLDLNDPDQVAVFKLYLDSK
jgi:hypothetical protein